MSPLFPASSEGTHSPAEAILDLLPDAVLKLDSQGGLSYVNRAGARLLRIPFPPAPEDFRGLGWAWIAGRLGPRFLTSLQPILQSRTAGTFYFECPPAPAWMEVQVVALEEGGFVFTLRDCGPLKQAQNDLSAVAAERDLALQATGLSAWRHRPARGTLQGSIAFSQLLGKPEEPYSAPLADFLERVHPEDRAAAAAIFSESAGHPLPTCEFRVILPGGEVRWLRMQGIALPATFSQDLCLTGVCQDITARRREEQRDREEMSVLEQSVADRTQQSADLAGRLSRELERSRPIEKDLQASRDFTDAVLRTIDTGILACDATGQLRLANRAMLELHGEIHWDLPPDRWPAAFGLYDPKTLEILRSSELPLVRALAGETVRSMELVVRPHGHSMRTIQVTGQPLVDHSGQLIGAFIAATDVTQRKRATRRIARALRRFRSLFDEAPIPYHEIDSKGVVVRVNRAECLLLERASDEIVSRPVWDFISEADRESARLAVLEKLDGRRPLAPFTRDYRTASGAILTMEIHENLILDEDGRIAGIRTAMLDITSRLQSKEQERKLLKETYARQEAQAATDEIHDILDRIGDAYMVFDRDFRYRYVNRKAAEFALKQAGELVGKCVWDEFPEAVQTGFYDALQKSLAEQVTVHFDNWYAPLGRWFENSVYPSPDGVSVFYRDITAKKNIEQVLSRKNQELEQINAELEQFAYIVSHDLQEPLRMVSGFAGLLARSYRSRLDENASEWIGFIEQGTERMRTMVEDLLELCRMGRIEAGQISAVDMNGALRQALFNLSETVRESAAEIISPRLPAVEGVESHLIRVWQNLIGNAIKYRSEARPEIRIGAERISDGWMFSVSDNGIGIEMEAAQRIFRMFKRLAPDSYPGSGVGLAISKRIIERLGGRIWVESTLGAGATFYFTIPDRGRLRRATS